MKHITINRALQIADEFGVKVNTPSNGVYMVNNTGPHLGAKAVMAAVLQACLRKVQA